MSKILKINKLEKGNIFAEDFKNLTENNLIELKRTQKANRAVVYAPNGTGKTSFAEIFNGNGDFDVEFEGTVYNENKGEFHIINDQLKRNIIKGETEDFIVGDNIREEKELLNKIEIFFTNLFAEDIGKKLKDKGIDKKSSPILKIINDEKLKFYIEDIVNVKAKGKNIEFDDFIAYIENIVEENVSSNIENFDDKLKFIIDDYNERQPLIQLINQLFQKYMEEKEKITPVVEIKIIQENNDVIEIIDKYNYKHNCVVCDNDKFDKEQVKKDKNKQNKAIISKLDKDIKILLDKLKTKKFDPFNIKSIVEEAIETGCLDEVENLINDIDEVEKIYLNSINNIFLNCTENILNDYARYKEIVDNPFEIDDESLLLIKETIYEYVGRELQIQRDDKTKNIIIKFDNSDLIDKERETLNLSTGEQNFISLAFELLKARNNKNAKLIIFDDPISSFDSIYKNKIAFYIIKVLDEHNVLILTHNVDLLKVLNYQQQECFNMYILNNAFGTNNGFIPVSKDELGFILGIDKVAKFLRTDIKDKIQNERLFLMAIVPFLRGFANIIGDTVSFKELSKLMHGYESDVISISEIYKKVMNCELQFSEYTISSLEIMDIDIFNINILKDDTDYKLLDKALKHTLTYLYLRLKVEYTLVKNLSETKHRKLFKNEKPSTSEIIRIALEEDSDLENRVFFMSRKTLLNEFNHFEGNLNIFQPAIDISDSALNKERDDILAKLEEL